MSVRKWALTKDEIAHTFNGAPGEQYPPILTPRQLAALLGLSAKTVYEWIARGRLQGAYRKRGKHVLIWRDRALETIFNGKEWTE